MRLPSVRDRQGRHKAAGQVPGRDALQLRRADVRKMRGGRSFIHAGPPG